MPCFKQNARIDSPLASASEINTRHRSRRATRVSPSNCSFMRDSIRPHCSVRPDGFTGRVPQDFILVFELVLTEANKPLVQKDFMFFL
jgi:hypothetical protein